MLPLSFSLAPKFNETLTLASSRDVVSLGLKFNDVLPLEKVLLDKAFIDSRRQSRYFKGNYLNLAIIFAVRDLPLILKTTLVALFGGNS
jgi:hypothetical protein